MRLRRLLLVSCLIVAASLIYCFADGSATNIAPDKALFDSMALTPMETAINAVDKLMGDSSLTGKILELHGGDFSFAEQQAFANDGTRDNIEMFWKLGYA